MKTNKFFFSIILPVFNAEKFLNSCLHSIRLQNFHDYEVILIDDFSSDNSEKIYLKFKKKIKNFVIKKNTKNYGVSLSRNKALKLAKGQYIIFLDSDDVLLKNTLRKLFAKILTFSNQNLYVVKHKELKKKAYKSKENIQNLKKNYIVKNKKLTFFKYFSQFCWNFIIEKKFLLENKIFFKNIRINEDHLFIANLFFLNPKIKKLNQITHGRRVSDINTLGRNVGFLVCESSIKNILFISQTRVFFSNNIIKKNFIEQRINFFLSRFLLNINLCNETEIKKILYLIKRNFSEINKVLKKFKIRIKYIDKKNLSFKYYERQIKKNLKKLNNFLKIQKTNNFHIFCASDYSKICIYLLSKLKFNVELCFDNNDNFLGKKIQDIEIKKFTNKYFLEDRKKILVCNLNRKAFIEIKNQLLNASLSKKQIIHLDLNFIFDN